MQDLHFQKIPIAYFEKCLNDIFADASEMLTKKGLAPDVVYAVSRSEEKWEPIPLWDKFEQSKFNYNEPDENALFLGNNKSGKAFMVSDETLRNKECVQFDVAEFEQFKEDYANVYHCEFFQPLDYIIYFSERGSFRLIHHSGFLVELTTG